MFHTLHVLTWLWPSLLLCVHVCVRVHVNVCACVCVHMSVCVLEVALQRLSQDVLHLLNHLLHLLLHLLTLIWNTHTNHFKTLVEDTECVLTAKLFSFSVLICFWIYFICICKRAHFYLFTFLCPHLFSHWSQRSFLVCVCVYGETWSDMRRRVCVCVCISPSISSARKGMVSGSSTM